MSIYFMEQSFNHTKTNPFQNDLPYTNEWIMLRLLETADFKLFTGGGVDGIFQLVITKDNIDWAYKVFDFIQYESESDKNIILAIDKQDYETAQSEYGSHSFKDDFLRPYEHRILLHTTGRENYDAIMSDGCLKSWNMLFYLRQICIPHRLFIAQCVISAVLGKEWI